MHASVVIPTYNHAKYLRASITSALSQEFKTEVIVVDDASTDETPRVLAEFADRVKVVRMSEHGGPSPCFNAGFEVSTGDYVMFLDADDEIHPEKIGLQVDRMLATDTEWCYCDVTIVLAPGRTLLSSQRYSYATRVNLEGYLFRDMVRENFIPSHAPLYRRGVLETVGLYQADALVEDWDLLTRVTALYPASYVPQVLATYIKRRGGRNDRGVLPNDPDCRHMRLNIGCGRPWYPVPSYINIDRFASGWSWEDGLADFTDASIRGVIGADALKVVPAAKLDDAVAELWRALRPGAPLALREESPERCKRVLTSHGFEVDDVDGHGLTWARKP